MKKLVLMLVMFFSVFTTVVAQEDQPCDGVYTDGHYLGNGLSVLKYFDYDFIHEGHMGATGEAIYNSVTNEFNLLSFIPEVYVHELERSPNRANFAHAYTETNTDKGLLIYSPDGTYTKLNLGFDVDSFVWAGDSMGLYVENRDYETDTNRYLYVGLDGTQTVLADELPLNNSSIFGHPNPSSGSFIYGKWVSQSTIELYEVDKSGQNTTLINTIVLPFENASPYTITVSNSGNIIGIGYHIYDDSTHAPDIEGIGFWDRRESDTLVNFIDGVDPIKGRWNNNELFGYFSPYSDPGVPMFHTLDFTEPNVLKHASYPLSVTHSTADMPGTFDWVDDTHIFTFETYPTIVDIVTGERRSEFVELCKPVNS